MTLPGWLQIAALLLIVGALTRPLGRGLHRIFEDEARPWPAVVVPLEQLCFRLIGTKGTGQSWRAYGLSVLAFGLVGLVATYLLLRLQGVLPLNPQGLPGLPPALAFNTAISFATNTNWQNYAGEVTLSAFSQMAALAWHNFVSPAAGLGVALALARGLTRRPAAGPADPKAALIGNFWVDMIRAVLFVLLPIATVAALLLASQGVVQSFAPYVDATTLDGAHQIIPLGPVASQAAIKTLGTNGGGFFGANSAHPFENPTPFANLVELVLLLLIPAALTHTYGRMAQDPRQGWALFAAMGVLLLAGIAVAYAAEAAGNPALQFLGLDGNAGNLEGKETRFGVAGSALFAAVTTATSGGAVNAMHDSFTALGGLVPLFNLLLGQVVFGGVGAGLFGMLLFAMLSVFIAGLMVGRTPEFLGKKIEAREMKLVMLYVLVFPLAILGFAGWSAGLPTALAQLGNGGPHGLSELLYAYASAAANNGSALAGLKGDTVWFNTTLGLAMLVGRFLMLLPVLAIAGSMVTKKVVPVGPGSLPTNGGLFVILLVAVVVIVGALTFLPALSLGPIYEYFAGAAGRVF